MGGSDKILEVVQFDSYDPLYMLMYSTRLVATKPQKKRTMFKVKASSPSSTLTIEVTDEFGNSRTEIMTRPKDFTLEQHINEQSDNIN